MNIAITFRHMDATDAVKAYATEKIGKLQKFVRQPLHGHIALSCQNHRHHTVEATLRAGHDDYVAHETSENMYASIDIVCDKLERQIRALKESSKKKGAERTSDRLLADDLARQEAIAGEE